MSKKEKEKETGNNIDDIINIVSKSKVGGSLMTLGSGQTDIDSISTGSLGIDEILGIGGLPRGRIIEIYGPESSGKTTLTLHCIAEHQKKGLHCAFIDAEHAIDANYARNIGVDIDELILSQPDSGEDALDTILELTKAGDVSLIVVDSVAALVPRAELEGDMDNNTIGSQARMLGKGLRKLVGIAEKNNTTIIFINQIRTKIGVMFGSPETTPGGNALKFSASVRLDIRRKSHIKQQTDIVGNLTKVKVVKNKVAPPAKETEFDIMFGEGISKVGELLDYGEKYELFEKKGSFYTLNEEKIQGKENAKLWLKENPEFATKLEEEIREKLGFK